MRSIMVIIFVHPAYKLVWGYVESEVWNGTGDQQPDRGEKFPAFPSMLTLEGANGMVDGGDVKGRVRRRGGMRREG